MSKKKNKDPDTFDKEYVKKTRTFPFAKTIFLVFCIVAQIALVLLAVFYNPQPQDVIKNYNIIVTPKDDGSLDIEYSFVWNALDMEEALTWVEIGMANVDFKIYQNSLSDTVKSAEKYVDGDYVSTRIYFKRAYNGGETVNFSFTVNQKGLLHADADGYYYAFVPSWFNRTPVENYRFFWQNLNARTANANKTVGKYLVWEGKMDMGTYVMMNVGYDKDAFTRAQVTPYRSFESDDVYDGLREDKIGTIVLVVIVALAIGIAELYIVDCFVSYHRGRGFMTGYGYHVHLYGRSNPRYTWARDNHAAKSGGRGGRGCACACACACAGGGRAGCSQKDTYAKKDGV